MFFIETDGCSVVLFYTDFNMIIMTFFAKLRQYKPKCFGAIPFALISLVDHELLQIITKRFVFKFSDKRYPNNSSIIFYNIDSGITIPIDISSCKNADRRCNIVFLMIFYAQGRCLKPVFFSYFN